MDILDRRTAIARASRLLAVLATVSLVISGLLVAPAQAQDLSNIVFDVEVEIEEGECTAAGCRNVTFDAQLVEGEGSTPDLTPEQLAALNEALDAGDFAITVEDSVGREETFEGRETLCLPPGDITGVDVDINAVVDALNTLDIEGGPFTAEDITINAFTDTITIEDCPDDGLPPDGDGPDDDGDESCENPRQVASIDGTDEDGLVEEQFTKTGGRFRVTYTVDFVDDAATDNEFTLTIRDSSDTVVRKISVTEDAEDADFIVSKGPGTYELEAEVVEGEATFEVTVEDCVGNDDNDGRNDGNDGRNDDNDGRNDDNDGRIVIIDDDDDDRIDDGKRIPDDVIIGSIPNKVLPNTGGPAILAPAGVLLISAAALGLFLMRRR